MNIRYRKATLSDVPLLRSFESRLVAYERAVETTLIQEGPLEYYEIPKLLEDTTNALVLIAEIGGRPVGCGLGQIKDNDPCYNEKRYGYIGLMFVDEAQRGKNVGGSIVQEIVAWLRGKGMNEIRLKVYASNPGAVKAYEKYGFEHYIHEMKFRKDL